MMVGRFVPVSVVIPCFRCTGTVRRAVESIIHQTQTPVEVILVDDGSADETPHVLREIEAQYPGWVKVVLLNENSGPACARNAGWSVATQPYIAFLDADDSWHSDKLHIQYEYMKINADVVLCGHQCIRFDKAGAHSQLLGRLRETEIKSIGLLFRSAFSTPTVMLKRDIPFRFSQGKRYAEDFLLWQQIAFAGLRAVRLEIPLAYIYKPFYGSQGLSSAMWKMERGELDNFVVLYRSGAIGVALYSYAVIFSVFKFFIRSLKVSWVRAKSAWLGTQMG